MEASKRTGERSGDALKDSLLLFIIFLIFEVFFQTILKMVIILYKSYFSQCDAFGFGNA